MAITNGYATLAEVKADLRLTTTADDARLERVIEAASRGIDQLAKRTFYTTAASARVFPGWGCVVFTDDAQAVTLVEESSDQTTWSTVPAAGYVPNARPPVRKLDRAGGFNWLPFVRVTATWGQASIPPQVRTACIILAVALFKRPDSPEGVLTGDFGAARIARTDPHVLGLIRPLARKVVG